MASYAKKFVQYGVRIVGGCCGTTPQHIRAIKAAVTGHGLSGFSGLKSVKSVESVAHPIPLNGKSRLGDKLSNRNFIKIVEMIPPMGHDFAAAIENAKYLQAHTVDAINVPDAPPASARMSAISLAILLEKSTEIESLAHYTCRDKNLLGMQADLLGAYALGLRNLFLTTGDPQQMGDYIDVTTVMDVDSIGLTNMVHRLNEGVDVGGKSIGRPTGFVIGVGANPGSISTDAADLKRFTYKVEAGAEFALTQPVFDAAVLERFLRHIEPCKIPVIVGILPLASYTMAEFLNYEVPGFSVPETILQRLREAESKSPDHARAEGIRIAQETLKDIRGLVQGVQIRGPFDRYETPVEVLS
jgi:homocysteine S-methyltransferase